MRSKYILYFREKINKKNILKILLSLLFIGLYLFNLEYSPVFSYDEGGNLLIPESLVTNHSYGIQTAEYFIHFPGKWSTGPPALLPIAVVFDFFGAGIWQGRAVMALYALLSTLMLYFVAKQVYNDGVALIAASLFGTSYTFLYYGRVVVGDMPALFFLLLASFFWLKAIDNSRINLLIISGIFYGLAVLTKYNFGLIIFVLISLYIHDTYLGKKSIKIEYVLFPIILILAILASWYLYQASIVGYQGVINRFHELINMGKRPLVGWNPMKQTILFSANLIMKNNLIFALGIPSMLYTLLYILDIKNKKVCTKELYLLSIAFAWFLWFLTSNGYDRYAIPALAMLCIFIAKTISDLFLSEYRGRSLRFDLGKREALKYVIGISIVLSLVLVNLTSAISLVKSHTDDAQQFSEYINNHVDINATITSEEPEINFLSNRPLNHNNYTHIRPDGNYEYVVVGPASRHNNVYPSTQLKNYSVEYANGRYVLFVREK